MGKWIPIKWHIEQKENDCSSEWSIWEIIFDCLMPDDKQEILISTKWGEVLQDVAHQDDGHYLDSSENWLDVAAWMPLPKPYREDGRDDERVGALIDVFEDFLAERGVRLPESVEDDAACGGAVVIRGGDYDALASRIKEFFGDGHEL